MNADTIWAFAIRETRNATPDQHATQSECIYPFGYTEWHTQRFDTT
jgi:hypothetical protein